MAPTLPASPSALKLRFQGEVLAEDLPRFKRALSDLCLGGHVNFAAECIGVAPKTLRDWLNPHTESCIPAKKLFALLRASRAWADAEQIAEVWRAAMGEGFFAISVPGLELIREESRATVAAQLAGLVPDHLELLRSAVTTNVTPFLRPAGRPNRSEESTARAAG